MAEDDYDGLYEYLAFSKYPTGSSKNQRRILRRKARVHYGVKSGRLLYSATSSATASLNEKTERNWKLVIKTREERLRILENCHSGTVGKMVYNVVRKSVISHHGMYCSVLYILIYKGGHFGRDKTYEKIASRFYWPQLYNDVKKHIASCISCQHVNEVKFNKVTAPLHPVPIHPKVWHRVSWYV